MRPNIDVMHTLKNIFENLFGTMLNIEGKTKDTYKARLDLEDMNIRHELHLQLKNAQEAMVAGPVQYTWMFPIERYLGHLKGSVRNRVRPEGSIAEAYIVDECLIFYTKYL
ncbi:hypothetical protein ACH5RR_006687 [Cinchona calisaya]|uniref:DUF4218 domain-containing protein n=1 Tax=Cinchona calisaya TaxID=153742 RepID=A0ABD3AQ01_9GENT